MTDKDLLNIYTNLAPFISEVCGPGCEVVVHDITMPESSLIAIHNNLSGREIGNPMTDLSYEIVKRGTHTNSDYLLNYNGKSKGADFLSSTYFIKNEGRLIGLLCINKDMSTVQSVNLALHSLLNRFNLTMPQESDISENLDNPVSTMVHSKITDIIAQSGVSPSRMSMEEKIHVVHQLNDNGILMMKGAVAEIAEQLGVSTPTIYRYLNKTLHE